MALFGVTCSANGMLNSVRQTTDKKVVDLRTDMQQLKAEVDALKKEMQDTKTALAQEVQDTKNVLAQVLQSALDTLNRPHE